MSVFWKFICTVFFCLLFPQAVSGKEMPEYARYNVALVDRFYPTSDQSLSVEERELDLALYGMMDLDQDGYNEPLYHGDIVRSILQHPDINVIQYQLKEKVLPIQALLEQLEMIRQDLFWAEPIDAILLPWESSTLISAFDAQLNEHHSDLYLSTLNEWASENKVWHVTLEIIQVIEDIIDYGGEVYTIAGNGGKRMVNTYSFARGVVTVGASEAELAHFVANNKFVDIYAPAAYIAKRLDDSDGNPVGYDLDGDSCSDISLTQLSGIVSFPKEHWRPLVGSSFAAPAALKSHLLGYSSSLDCY